MDFKKALQGNLISVSIWIIGVVFTGLNLYLTSQLAPLTKDLAVLATEVKANDQRDLTEHPTFVTRQEHKDLVDRLVRIENKLDRLSFK